MENQDMVVNNEVIEVAEEVIETGSGNAWKFGIGAVAIVGLGYGIYRIVKKIKANKEQYVTYELTEENSCDECIEEID